MIRIDGRKPTQLRPVKIHTNYIENPHGSAMIEIGRTKVICTAMIEENVPKFMKGEGKGWLTAEYGMLPASTPERTTRDITKGRINGRSQEIQRLIGRCLRTVLDLSKIGEKTIWVDCDVIQADGGTRTAAITSGFIAVSLALNKFLKQGIILESPIKEYLAAVSVGIVENKTVLDLCYAEDSTASVDMNVVMTSGGRFIEIQGTAEKHPFTAVQLNDMLKIAHQGIKQLIKLQKDAVTRIDTDFKNADEHGKKK